MNQPFAGYDPEAGLLQRFRQWRDVFPGVILIDALRPSVSIAHGYLMMFALAVCWVVPRPFTETWVSEGSVQIAQNPVRWVATVALWMMILLVPAVTVMRSGALFSAGKETGCLSSLRLVVSLSPRLVSILLAFASVPVVCWLALHCLGWLARLPGRWGNYGHEIGGLLALPIMMVVAMFLTVCVPACLLALAGTALQTKDDTVDLVSRGLEYVTRRFFMLLFYVAVSVLLAALVAGLAWLAVTASLAFCLFSLGAGPNLPVALTAIASMIPYVIGLNAWLGQWGCIYLLLRQSANGQEIEDLNWVLFHNQPVEGLPGLPPSRL